MMHAHHKNLFWTVLSQIGKKDLLQMILGESQTLPMISRLIGLKMLTIISLELNHQECSKFWMIWNVETIFRSPTQFSAQQKTKEQK